MATTRPTLDEKIDQLMSARPNWAVDYGVENGHVALVIFKYRTAERHRNTNDLVEMTKKTFPMTNWFASVCSWIDYQIARGPSTA